MPAEIDIDVPRNADYYEEWQLLDVDREPIDISDDTLSANARLISGGDLVASATITKTDAANGMFEMRWRGSDFDDVTGTTELARPVYSLLHVFPDGIVNVPVRGHINLIPGI